MRLRRLLVEVSLFVLWSLCSGSCAAGCHVTRLTPDTTSRTFAPKGGRSGKLEDKLSTETPAPCMKGYMWSLVLVRAALCPSTTILWCGCPCFFCGFVALKAMRSHSDRSLDTSPVSPPTSRM